MNKTIIFFLFLLYGISSHGLTLPCQIPSQAAANCELDRMHGLDWYDSEARYLDVLYGARFTGMDPLAEESTEVSPYAYCRNNFVNRIDPDGKDDYYSYAGQFLFRDNKTTDNIIIRNEFLYHMKQISGAEWLQTDYPIQNVTLSAEAYSNIFTDVLYRNNFNLNMLLNNCISIVKLEKSPEGKPYDYKLAEAYQHERTIPWENAPIAATRVCGNDVRVTAYIFPKGDENRDFLSTVSNIVSILGVHEYRGHGLFGIKEENHRNILNMQKKHASWQSITDKLRNLYKEFESDNFSNYGKK